jgi:hypothetical protein
LQLLVRLDPAHLAGGGLRPGQLALEELGDGPGARVFERLGVDPELGDLLPHHRIAGDRATVLLHPAREVDHRLQRDAQPHLQSEAEGQALEHQRGQPDGPAVVDLAQNLALVHAHVVEEDLVELGVSGDLLERLHRHAGRVHVEQEVGDALVLRRIGIGAGQQHHPVGHVGE